MKIENEFTVPAPIDEAWALLTDIPAIAPCLPGAKLTGTDGSEHEGQITVKVGPITAQYIGTAELTVKDDDAHHAEIVAQGRDKRGAGTARADIQADLVPDGDGTRVVIDTDLHVSGKVAQFGRGTMADISKKLLGQFAECLEGKLTAPAPGAAEETAARPDGDAAAAAGSTGSPATTSAAAAGGGEEQEEDGGALDLLDVAGGAIAKRLAPVAIGVVVLVVLYIILR